MIILKTERTIIRDHCPADLLTHHALLSDAELMKWVNNVGTNTLEESRENLFSAIAEIGRLDRKFYFLRIEEKDTCRHIGEIGYTVMSEAASGKTVHLGYFLHKEYWGRGYATEAAREVIRFAFVENGVWEIAIGCYKENVASERVMQKCGFRFVRELDVQYAGTTKQRVEYALTKEDWLQMNP